MAGGVVGGPMVSSKVYPGKLTWNVCIATMLAAFGGSIFGYDIGISGGVTSVTSQVTDSSNLYCKFNSFTLTMFTSSLYLAALLSTLLATYLTRKFGRKVSMLIGGASFCAGALFNGFAEHTWMLYVGRILLGVGIGFANQAVPLYLSEIAPSQHRGALNIMFQLSITIGILVANAVNVGFARIDGGWGWRLSVGGVVVPAIAFIVGALIVPDSPNSLLERGKLQEAKENLRKIRGVEDVDEEFKDLVAASEQSKKIENPMYNLFFTRKYRPQLTLAILIPLFQQLTGMNVFMFYVPVLFQTMGFKNNAALVSALITGVVTMLATIVVALLNVDRLGRRFLFLQGGVQMIICEVFITIAIGLKFGLSGIPGVLDLWFSVSVVTVICIYIAGFASSWGSLGWLVPSEISPVEVRSAAQGVNVFVNMLFTFVIGQIFLQMLCALRIGLFIFFTVWAVVMTFFVYFFVPETKGIPIEKMSGIWKQHWYWKRFVPDEEKDLKEKKH